MQRCGDIQPRQLNRRLPAHPARREVNSGNSTDDDANSTAIVDAIPRESGKFSTYSIPPVLANKFLYITKVMTLSTTIPAPNSKAMDVSVGMKIPVRYKTNATP